jgi:hypothetical protein
VALCLSISSLFGGEIVIFADFGCFWLLLVAFGCGGLIFGFWLLLVAFGFWWFFFGLPLPCQGFLADFTVRVIIAEDWETFFKETVGCHSILHSN